MSADKLSGTVSIPSRSGSYSNTPCHLIYGGAKYALNKILTSFDCLVAYFKCNMAYGSLGLNLGQRFSYTFVYARGRYFTLALLLS